MIPPSIPSDEARFGRCQPWSPAVRRGEVATSAVEVVSGPGHGRSRDRTGPNDA